MGDLLAQWLCGIRGHLFMLQIDLGHMWLVCDRCGRKTPGWRV